MSRLFQVLSKLADFAEKNPKLYKSLIGRKPIHTLTIEEYLILFDEAKENFTDSDRELIKNQK